MYIHSVFVTDIECPIMSGNSATLGAGLEYPDGIATRLTFPSIEMHASRSEDLCLKERDCIFTTIVQVEVRGNWLGDAMLRD